MQQSIWPPLGLGLSGGGEIGRTFTNYIDFFEGLISVVSQWLNNLLELYWFLLIVYSNTTFPVARPSLCCTPTQSFMSSSNVQVSFVLFYAYMMCRTCVLMFHSFLGMKNGFVSIKNPPNLTPVRVALILLLPVRWFFVYPLTNRIPTIYKS